MTSSNLYLGIDFGTSNSSLAWVRDNSLQRASPHVDREVLTFERPDLGASSGAVSTRLPTVIGRALRGKGGESLHGWQWITSLFAPAQGGPARRAAASSPRHGRDFFRSVKSDLGTYRVYPYAWSADLRTPSRVAGAILRDLLDKARDHGLGGDDLAQAGRHRRAGGATGRGTRGHAGSGDAAGSPRAWSVDRQPVAALAAG